MSRYYDDEEWYLPREHDHGFLSPEAPPRPLNRRRQPSRGEHGEERPHLHRKYHSDNGAFIHPAIEWEGHQDASPRSRSRGRKTLDIDWDARKSRTSNRQQIPSPPRALSTRPRVQYQQNYSGIEAFDHHTAEPGEDEASLSRRPSKRRPRPILELHSPQPLGFDDPSLPTRESVMGHSSVKQATLLKRSSSRPGARRSHSAYDSDSRTKQIPSPPGIHRVKDFQTHGYVVSTRASSPPSNLTITSDDDDWGSENQWTTAMTQKPQGSSTPDSRAQRRKSMSKTRPKDQGRSPDGTPLARSTRACVRYQVPSPPPVDRRRHSSVDGLSTHTEHLQETPEAETMSHLSYGPLKTGRRDKTTPRSDRVQSLQVPLAVPGSFPSLSEDILPEDSRSDTSPSRRKSLSGAASSLNSGSTLRQSASPSVSGVLGEHVYRYKPLGALQFRLVKISPKTMSLIKCELLHYSLEDPPNYVAISYAWGDVDDKKKIQLEGANISVSASLHGALFALRAKKESVLVWIDALCIDQQNREERTQQVQLMTYIYSRATSVAIWLGPEVDDSSTAMEFLNELVAGPTDSKRMNLLMSSKARKLQFASVVALFEREYWSRLWVVQEIFNASEITAYCGDLSLPWSAFQLASDIFWNHRGLIDYYFPGSLSHGGQQASSTQFTFSQVLLYHGPSSIPDVDSFHGLGEESLLEVMRVCRRKLSSDPRDKLYGILGLLAEDIRNEFPIDYGVSMKEVYVRVSDYLICTTERLDVLCEAVHFPLHTSTSLPSWVPDWSHNPETTALGRSFNFSAAGATKAAAKVLDDRRRLEISAIHLDAIQGHGIAVGTLCTLADYVMSFIHWRALLLSNTEDGESPSRQEAFCKTLSLGQLPPDWKKGSWKAACYHVFASLAQERISRLPLDEELWRYVDVNVGVKAEDRRRFLQEHFGSRMMGRCFCITEDGSMGMGSGFMTVGDVVVIPLGCSTPVLLRPEGPRGEYRYVGDVYIHGYMNGKAVDEWKSGERELRKYVLH